MLAGRQLLRERLERQTQLILHSPEEIVEIDALSQDIKDATSEIIREVNWGAIMTIVDKMSNMSSPVILKEGIRALRKRIENPPSPIVVLHALTLTESLVKNGGRKLHREIATEKFLKCLEKLYHRHKSGYEHDSCEVSSRVLELIQAWGEAFLPHQRELPLFCKTYHDMRKKGVSFPEQYDESRAPVLTPPPSDSHATIECAFAGLSNVDFLVVGLNVVEMMEDVLHSVKNEELESNNILLELLDQCKTMEKKLVGIIEQAVMSAAEQDNIVKYLALNDSVQAVIKKYDDRLAALTQSSASSPKSDTDEKQSSPGTRSIDVNAPVENDDDLLDFLSPTSKVDNSIINEPKPEKKKRPQTTRAAPVTNHPDAVAGKKIVIRAKSEDAKRAKVPILMPPPSDSGKVNKPVRRSSSSCRRPSADFIEPEKQQQGAYGKLPSFSETAVTAAATPESTALPAAPVVLMAAVDEFDAFTRERSASREKVKVPASVAISSSNDLISDFADFSPTVATTNTTQSSSAVAVAIDDPFAMLEINASAVPSSQNVNPFASPVNRTRATSTNPFDSPEKKAPTSTSDPFADLLA